MSSQHSTEVSQIFRNVIEKITKIAMYTNDSQLTMYSLTCSSNKGVITSLDVMRIMQFSL